MWYIYIHNKDLQKGSLYCLWLMYVCKGTHSSKRTHSTRGIPVLPLTYACMCIVYVYYVCTCITWITYVHGLYMFIMYVYTCIMCAYVLHMFIMYVHVLYIFVRCVCVSYIHVLCLQRTTGAHSQKWRFSCICTVFTSYIHALCLHHTYMYCVYIIHTCTVSTKKDWYTFWKVKSDKSDAFPKKDWYIFWKVTPFQRNCTKSPSLTL